MLNLNDLRVFVRAVESGGFAAAARLMGTPRSTVSKRVAELEGVLGVRLIQRTSRSFALTEIGREFYDHARAALIEVTAAEDVVHTRTAEPRGTVRITTSVPVAQFRLAAQLPELMHTFPLIEIQVHVSDRFVDLIHEGFDIAIRSHAKPLPDSGLVQRRMAVEPVMLGASTAYLEQHGIPLTPQDLTHHDGIHGSLSDTEWRLLNRRTGQVATATPRARLRVDEAGMLAQAAIAGLGIAPLPESVIEVGRSQGKIVSVLPDWTESTITTTILTPHRRGQLPAVRAVIDYLAQ